MATKKSKFQSIVTLVNSNKSFKAIDLVKDNPETAAVISKLIASNIQPTYDKHGNREIELPVYNNFTTLSREISEKTEDADSILQLFPDMELSAQILISSIISPKDMGGGEVTFTVPEEMMFSEASALMLAEIKTYFHKDYKIEPLLPKILRKVLFQSGSYVTAVIPESSLDKLINSNVSQAREAYSDYIGADNQIKNTGILGGSEKFSTKSSGIATESLNINASNLKYDTSVKLKDLALEIVSVLSNYSADSPKLSTEELTYKNSLVNVYDNPYYLKFPSILDKKRADIVANSIYGKAIHHLTRKTTASEAVSTIGGIRTGFSSVKLSDSDLTPLIYKGRYTEMKPFIKVKSADELERESIGTPLVLHLPSESVIPVYTPGNPEKHVGYFVLIDNEGNPLTKNSNTDHFGDLQTRLNGVNKNMSSYLTDKVKNAFNPMTGNMDSAIASRLYADVIEADLIARLRNGVYGQNVAIGRNDDVYRIMLARTLANQHTNILYIPEILVTYFAQRFDERGIGKALMDDMRILNSLRAMTLFARVQASIKNSIGRTAVALKLDETDPDPRKTIEIAIHEVSKTRQQYFPVGLNTPTDIADWLQKSGYEFTFSGHPGLPDTSIEFTEKNSNYVQPDQALQDDLRKQAIMTCGLSPETVDNAGNAEFATTVVTNNILFTKRVMQAQELFIPQLTDHARKVAFNDGALIKKLKNVIVDNYDKIIATLNKEVIDPNVLSDKNQLAAWAVSEFLSNFEVSLPQPDSVTIENQSAAFEAYEKALDNAIKYWIGNEIMPTDLTGEIGQKADDIRNMVKAHFMREWCIKNSYVPELAQITSSEDGKPKLNVIELQKNHLRGLIKSGVTLLNNMRTIADAADEDVKNITGDKELEESNSPLEGSGGGSSSSGGGGGGFGDFGGDDFGMGGDSDMPGMDEDEGSENDNPEDDGTGDGGLPDLGSIS